MTPVPMGNYEDYCMNDPATGKTVAGVCHKRGMKADIPSQWLLYVGLPNIKDSLKKYTAKGGNVIRDWNGQPGGIAIIQDPAGAVMALMQAMKK